MDGSMLSAMDFCAISAYPYPTETKPRNSTKPPSQAFWKVRIDDHDRARHPACNNIQISRKPKSSYEERTEGAAPLCVGSCQSHVYSPALGITHRRRIE